jgi:Protein of unknown function (DUF1761)
MHNAITHLNWLAVSVVTLAGFLLGWLWYSPMLFAKTWMKEMNMTKESFEANPPNMGVLFGSCLLYTFVSTFGLAVLLSAHGTTEWLKGAELGAFVGAILVAPRMLNGALWEFRSARLLRITVGYELVMFAVQGAILAVWH